MERHLVDMGHYGKGWVFHQKTFEQGGPNPLLSFGPVDIYLEQLFKQGMSLFAEGFETKLSSPRRIRLYLLKKDLSGQRRLFRCGSAHYSDLTCKPLQCFVKKEVSSQGAPMQFPWWFEDPLQALVALYPEKKKKTPPMVGNQTLKQYVSQLP
jgi:hypothetical protein